MPDDRRTRRTCYMAKYGCKHARNIKEVHRKLLHLLLAEWSTQQLRSPGAINTDHAKHRSGVRIDEAFYSGEAYHVWGLECSWFA